MDNLRILAKDQSTTQLVAQKGGLETVLKILKTQDFDTELVQKALSLLKEMIANEEILASAFEHDTLSVLNNIISAQKKEPKVLETVKLSF